MVSCDDCNVSHNSKATRIDCKQQGQSEFERPTKVVFYRIQDFEANNNTASYS